MTTSLRHVTLSAPAPALALDTAGTDERVVRGMVVPYGVTGRTDAGEVAVRAGGVRVPAELGRIKLFSDHGRHTPIGYAVSADDGADGLRMAFRVAHTPAGDAALLEATEGVRDAFSVELDDADIRAGWIESASLVATALVPLPAYAGARVNAGAIPPEGSTMTAPPILEPTATPAEPAPAATLTSAPAPAVAASLNPTPARHSVVTAAQGIEAVRRVVRGATDAAQVNAALSDVVPANDTGQGFIRDQWLGELWTPVAVQRSYVSSMAAGVLTGMTFYGWQWALRPEVDDYAGNKAAIPSNPVSIVPASGNAYRLAGGWDVDRIFIDLAAPGFLEAMFSAAVADYGNKSNAKAGAFLAANATPLSNTVTNLVDGLAACAAALAANGAAVSWVAIAADLWSDYLSLTSAEAPWWLSIAAGSVSIKTPSGNVADLSFFVDPSLPAGTIMAGDRRAATHYEAAGSPLRVQAVNVPNGGIDLGVFGYAGDLLNSALGIVKLVVGP